MKRREFMASLGAAGAAIALPASQAIAQVPDFDPRMLEIVTRGAAATRARVALELPVLADNGNAITMKVAVASPMSAADHVRRIHLVSERNPVRLMAAFHLGPRSGRAEVVSRLRLAGSQWVAAVAEMSDGTFFYAAERVAVTVSACIDES